MSEFASRWVVEFDGELHGPFDNEDECFAFAAKTSREPNDWTPIELKHPIDTIALVSLESAPMLEP